MVGPILDFTMVQILVKLNLITKQISHHMTMQVLLQIISHLFFCFYKSTHLVDLFTGQDAPIKEHGDVHNPKYKGMNHDYMSV
jgi:hypothetical protein